MNITILLQKGFNRIVWGLGTAFPLGLKTVPKKYRIPKDIKKDYLLYLLIRLIIGSLYLAIVKKVDLCIPMLYSAIWLLEILVSIIYETSIYVTLWLQMKLRHHDDYPWNFLRHLLTKGHIISEAIFCFFNSSKKRTKNFCLIVAPAIWEFRVSMINPKIFLNQKDDWFVSK